MQSILNQQQPGLKKFITVSAILHIIILSGGLFFIKTAPSRVLFAPTYTTVELVAPPSGRGSSKRKRAARRITKKISTIKSSAKAASASRTKKSKKVIIKKITIKTKKATSKTVLIPDAAKVKASPPAKEEVDDVSAAIAALQQKVTEQEEDEFIERRIKELTELDREEEAISHEIAGLREEILKSGISVDALPDETGGAGSDGGPGTGGSSNSLNLSQLDIAFIEYYNSVGSMIRSEWSFPGQAVPGLQAIIAIKIAQDGKVLALRVELTSGNTLFDSSAVRAVEKVGDFPPLPKDLKGEFLEIGIRFCPGGCKK